MTRLAAPNTARPGEHMAKESLEPSKASSTEAKHSEHKLSGLEIEIHRGKGKEVSGHTVRHTFMANPSKTGAFMEAPERASYVFDGKGQSSTHGHILDHIEKHLPHLQARDEENVDEGREHEQQGEEEYGE